MGQCLRLVWFTLAFLIVFISEKFAQGDDEAEGIATPEDFAIAVHVTDIGMRNPLVAVRVACVDQNCWPFDSSQLEAELERLNVYKIHYLQINDAVITPHMLRDFDFDRFDVDTWVLDSNPYDRDAIEEAWSSLAHFRRHDLENFLQSKRRFHCENLLHDYYDGQTWKLKTDPNWNNAPCMNRHGCPTPYAVDLVCIRIRANDYRVPDKLNDDEPLSLVHAEVDPDGTAGAAGHVQRHLLPIAKPPAQPLVEDPIYVLSLQNVEGAPKSNEHRFDTYVQAWSAHCGPQIQQHVSTLCCGQPHAPSTKNIYRMVWSCVSLLTRSATSLTD